MVGTIAKAVAIAVLGSAGIAQANGASGSTPYPEALNVAPNTHWFASWQENTNPAPADFFATPFANNGTIPFVQNQMTLSANAGRPLGIKINSPLSSGNAANLFNTKYGIGKKAISYIFGDFEGGNGSYDSDPAVRAPVSPPSRPWSTRSATTASGASTPTSANSPSPRSTESASATSRTRPAVARSSTPTRITRAAA